ncbi:MAG: hypothetical protein N3B14_04290 [Thermoleophilia bacterium]|nr:hypothetical protein [Thermoleophilia bacterium]
MACFLAPAGVAVVTTIVQKVVSSREKTAQTTKLERLATHQQHPGASWSRRLRWLNTMLWGGSLLLCFEHIWHGEVVPWPPFLTAMTEPQGIGAMLREIAIYGSAMTAAILLAWGTMIVGDAWLARLRRRAASVNEPGSVSERS